MDTPILGACNVSLSPIFSMYSILLALTLKNNLLSISQLTKSLDYSLTLYSTYCVFQNNPTRMMIGIGKERGCF